MPRAPAAAAAVALAGLAGALPGQDRGPLPQELAEVAAGYAAKVAASALFVSGRSLESVLAQELAPDTTLHALIAPLLRFEVDRLRHTVTARLGTARAMAAHIDGLGCTLVRGVDLATLRQRALPPPPAGGDPEQQDWPAGERLPELAWPDDVDRAALDAAIAAAFAETPGRPLMRTRAVVVVRDGRLLAERYAEGFHRRMPLPGWSMTKTWVDALLGIRVAQGRLDPAAPLPVPEWRGNGDPRGELRLDHLLRMQAGLEWNESYDDTGGDVARMLFLAPDAGGYAAAKPAQHAAGAAFAYSSGTTNVLCRILRGTFADDADHRAFPRDALFARIGMRSARLETDPSGTFVGSSLGFATARDWARFGMLHLQDGVWNGVEVVPGDWIRAARTPTANADRGRFGRHLWLNAGAGDDAANRPFPHLPADLFYLSGYEGQYAAVFPGQRLVVVRLGCTRRGGFDLPGFLSRVLAACGG